MITSRRCRRTGRGSRFALIAAAGGSTWCQSWAVNRSWLPAKGAAPASHLTEGGSPTGSHSSISSAIRMWCLLREAPLEESAWAMRRRSVRLRSQTRAPVWSPDGRRLLVSTWTDWWVVPVSEGVAIQTGALDLIRASGLRLPEEISFAFVPEDWSGEEGDTIIFSAFSADSRNLWKIGIDSDTWRAIGPPTRFTFGTEAEQQVSLSGNRRMVFASLTRTSNIWSLPVDANHARVTSEPRAITQEARQLTRPDVSRDGRILVYQDEKHQSDIRVRNLETGKETGGLSSAADELLPVVSADGSTVLYTVPPDRIYAVPAGGGLPRLICETCGPLPYFALSPDGGRLAYTAPDGVMEIELRTGRRKRITSRYHHIPESPLEIRVSEMRYSPDARWLAFHA